MGKRKRMREEKRNKKTERGRKWEKGRVKREGKGRKILSKFATAGKISSLQPVPKNPYLTAPNLKFWIRPVADSRGERPPCLLTKCILKQVKILHQNAWFLHKIFKKFLGRGHSPFPIPHPHPSAAPFGIFGSATAYALDKILMHLEKVLKFATPWI